MRRHSGRFAWLAVAGLLCLAGCAGTMKPTEFTNPDFDFSYVERVAVLPFENLTNDRQAGYRATRLTVTELLASGALDVVEPGEVQAAQLKIQGGQPGRFGPPSTEQIISLGQALRVQAIILGSVTQSENLRSGAVQIPVVTLDAHMVETETGATVWAATHTAKGGSTGAKVLGTGGEPISKTTRRCVRGLLETLID
jgi:TolB-like protein